MCVSIGMSMGVGVGVRVGVSEGQRCRVRNRPGRVNTLIALKLKAWLYPVSMRRHRMREANSSQPCCPNAPRHRASRHTGGAPHTWTPLQAATIQEAKDGCRRGGISGQVMGVCQSVVLELRQEEGRVNVGVSVVHLGMVRLGSTRCPQRRHGVGAGVFTQSPQCWSVRAQIWTS